jgi:hypothetical protein
MSTRLKTLPNEYDKLEEDEDGHRV